MTHDVIKEYLKSLGIDEDISERLPKGVSFSTKKRSTGLRFPNTSAIEPPSQDRYQNSLDSSQRNSAYDSPIPKKTSLTEQAQLSSFTLRLPASSTIQTATYYPDDQALSVSFKSGATYGYDDVPISVVMRWMRASSAGSHFFYNIRTSFVYHKV